MAGVKKTFEVPFFRDIVRLSQGHRCSNYDELFVLIYVFETVIGLVVLKLPLVFIEIKWLVPKNLFL